jgi:lipopolysaccharide export system permease protein
MKGNRILDRYIIRKFLGTFFFAIALIMMIVIVFDMAENVDDFLEKKAPVRAIIFDYYVNFIPYFVNLFSPLFTFISVIFFTARLAANTEIVAILSSGVSFRRLMLPYLISSLILVSLSFYLANFLIPFTNITKLAFESEYLKTTKKRHGYNIHMQMQPGEYIYMESYNHEFDKGYLFTLEKIEADGMEIKITAENIVWNPDSSHWEMTNVWYRRIDGFNEQLQNFERIDTVLALKPSDLKTNRKLVETMNYRQLRSFIAEERLKGVEGIEYYEVEKHKRIAFPFATIVLTFIGLALSSRKVRGGIGFHLAIGILISFAYILFMQISTTFATNGDLSPLVAVWLPNLLFAALALALLKIAPK